MAAKFLILPYVMIRQSRSSICYGTTFLNTTAGVWKNPPWSQLKPDIRWRLIETFLFFPMKINSPENVKFCTHTSESDQNVKAWNNRAWNFPSFHILSQFSMWNNMCLTERTHVQKLITDYIYIYIRRPNYFFFRAGNSKKPLFYSHSHMV